MRAVLSLVHKFVLGT